MRLPEIPQLEAFRAVVVEGHFGRAAEALGIAQPTLSHRIRALEEAVGARLFERGRAGVRLTAAGVAYARRVDGLLDLLGKAGNEARSAGEGLGGRLVVACSGALSCTPLPDALDVLLRERPDMAVELQTRGLADQLGALLDGELDVILPERKGAGEKKRCLKAGGFLYYPADFPHTIRTVSDVPAKYVMFKWINTAVKPAGRL